MTVTTDATGTPSLRDKILPYALANAIKFEGKASQGSVMGAVIGAHPDFKADMKGLAIQVAAVLKEIASMSVDTQRAKLELLAPQLLEKKESTKRLGLPDLPNLPADPTKLKMRIAPYPSGAIHLGNTKQLVLNDEYVKKYGGTMVLFFDDTIGSEEKNVTPEAYDLIQEGGLWLGCTFHETYYKSDRLEIYYQYAQQLIEKGAAYVCTCPSDVMRTNREKGIACSHRDHDVQKVLNDWTAMLLGSFKEGEAALRIKTDMRHKNPAFRDRVLLRVCERTHPRVGNKYRVWPLLDFSWAIDDHLIDITHVMRGKDLMIESDMERFIWNIFGWPLLEIIHTGLMQIEGVKISKSKAKKEVLSGEYIGWDDPRTWSLQAMRRRGIKAKAIRDFLLASGINANETTVPIESLYAENRKLIDLDTDRHFFVRDPVSIHVAGAQTHEIRIELHPDFPARGHRHFTTGQDFLITKADHDQLESGKLYRLMDCLNFRKDDDILEYVDMSIETYRKEGTRIMHWLPADPAQTVDVEILMDDASIIKGKGEAALTTLSPGTLAQFERFGFCRIDGITAGEGGKPLVQCWWTHK